VHPAIRLPAEGLFRAFTPDGESQVSHDLDHHHHHHQISAFPSEDSFEDRLAVIFIGPAISRASARERQRPRSNFRSLNFLSLENRTRVGWRRCLQAAVTASH
jgi:hypothetical protein